MGKYFAGSSVYPRIPEPTTEERSVANNEYNQLYHANVAIQAGGGQVFSSSNKINVMGAVGMLLLLAVVLHVMR